MFAIEIKFEYSKLSQHFGGENSRIKICGLICLGVAGSVFMFNPPVPGVQDLKQQACSCLINSYIEQIVYKQRNIKQNVVGVVFMFNSPVPQVQDMKQQAQIVY